MQVGKTPQITSNFSLPPYTNLGEEITNNVVMYSFGATSYSGFAGGLVDLNNPSTLLVNFNSAGDFIDLRFDLRRKLIVRAININFLTVNGTTYCDYLFQISNDGAIWTTVLSHPSTTAAYMSSTIQDKEFRYFRIYGVCIAGGGSGTTSIEFTKLRFFIDSTQYSY